MTDLIIKSFQEVRDQHIHLMSRSISSLCLVEMNEENEMKMNQTHFYLCLNSDWWLKSNKHNLVTAFSDGEDEKNNDDIFRLFTSPFSLQFTSVFSIELVSDTALNLSKHNYVLLIKWKKRSKRKQQSKKYNVNWKWEWFRFMKKIDFVKESRWLWYKKIVIDDVHNYRRFVSAVVETDQCSVSVEWKEGEIRKEEV